MVAQLSSLNALPASDDIHAPVLIVGAGPVGLALALGLAQLGVRSVVLERNPATSVQSKAPAIHIRTREIFRQWGVDARMLDEGVLCEELTLHAPKPGRTPILSVDMRELGAEAYRPGLLFLEQGKTERILLDAAAATGLCDVRFDTEVVGMEMDADGVSITTRAHGRAHGKEAWLRGNYLVGCDGAHSFVRRSLGLSFDGSTYSIRPLLADVRIVDARDALPWPRLYNGVNGLTAALRLQPGHWRIISLESSARTRSEAIPDSELAARVGDVLGEGPLEVIWASRFRIHLRHAPRFRVGRTLLAGDAAHIHSPAGGLGMNTGIQDAHNLAWKLAYALMGGDSARLLDSYDVERRAVAVESVSGYADFLTRTFIQTPRLIRSFMFALMGRMLTIRPMRRRALRQATMIGLDYPTSPILNRADHAAGKRAPNVELVSPQGESVRLYDLLGQGSALLHINSAYINSGHINSAMDEAALPGDGFPAPAKIRIGPGGYVEPAGVLTGLLKGRSGVILVRPDMYIAWVKAHADAAPAAVRFALGFDVPTG